MDGPVRKQGFTLTEVLVAVAIFTVIMSGVVALFVSSMRAVKSGNLTMNALEETRTAFNVIERDLTTAFSARDSGDEFQFYGTPVGFTFIGLERSYDPGSSEPNLARITYVLHPNAGAGSFDTEVYDESTGTFVPGTVQTYSLIRYVEPGVEDLDTFPVDWEFYRTEDELWGSATIRQALREIDDLKAEAWPDDVIEDLERTKKRQLWIRMLSEAELGPLPRFWGSLGIEPNRRSAMDYVVAQNIVATTPPGITEDDKAYTGDTFFEYGLTDSGAIVWEPFWNADYNLPYGTRFAAGVTQQDAADPWFRYEYDPTDPNSNPLDAEIGTPFRPRLPEVVKLRATFKYESPYIGAPDLERSFEQVIDIPCGYMRSVPAGGP